MLKAARSLVCLVVVAVPWWAPAQPPITANRTIQEAVAAKDPASLRRQYDHATEKKKIEACFRSWVSPAALLSYATGAVWGQLWDAPSEWKEGGKGYSLRFVSAYGQHLVNSTLLLAGTSLFHEDNRYVPSGETSFRGRLEYAIESSVVTRHDDSDGGSHRRVSFSRIAAFAGAAAVSRAWQPPSARGMNHAAISFDASIAATAGFNIVREFLHFR